MPSPTNTRTQPPAKDQKPKHHSLLDGFTFKWSKRHGKFKSSAVITEVKEKEGTTTESSSGDADAGSTDQGSAHANDRQADDGSFLGRMKARARRVRDEGKKASEDIKEKMAKSTIPHH